MNHSTNKKASISIIPKLFPSIINLVVILNTNINESINQLINQSIYTLILFYPDNNKKKQIEKYLIIHYSFTPISQLKNRKSTSFRCLFLHFHKLSLKLRLIKTVPVLVRLLLLYQAYAFYLIAFQLVGPFYL